eukprot:1450214-Pleurochrysis_carterae.AAC.1
MHGDSALTLASMCEELGSSTSTGICKARAGRVCVMAGPFFTLEGAGRALGSVRCLRMRCAPCAAVG